MAGKGKPAMVHVEAQCGHTDTYYLAPGENLTIKGGRFTFCLACNATCPTCKGKGYTLSHFVNGDDIEWPCAECQTTGVKSEKS